MLTIFLDSISIDSKYNEKRGLIEDLLHRDPNLFSILRSTCDVNQEKIRQIPSVPNIEWNNQVALDKIYQSLNFRPRNCCQEQFFFNMSKYANQKKDDYNHESAYVTENPIYFEKYLPGGEKETCLKSFFPNLILVNLERLKEVLDYYEKKNDSYYFDHAKLNLKWEWYMKTLYSNLPELPSMLSKHVLNTDMTDFLSALAFRYEKMLYCVNCIGIEHYFGNLKKDLIDPSVVSQAVTSLRTGNANITDLRGFVDPDNLFLLFYHAEYMISLVTGVFDNLALLTQNRYSILSDKIRVSLSKDAGKEFLENIENLNPDLGRHIREYREFINLIYEFREKVIHREGLRQIYSPIASNWSSFAKIPTEIKHGLKRCGDAKSEYKIISKWGVVEQNSFLVLDPYFFSKQSLCTLTKFTNDYLRIIN